jgi:hypothetical protein
MTRLATLFASVTLLAVVAHSGSAEKAVEFAHEVRPILANNCFTCHGPDPKTRKANLRLDLREEAIKLAKSGTAPIVPGKAAASGVIQRIHSEEPSEVMPPPKTKKTLKPAEKELLKRWIDAGAEYPLHWSFVRPVRPPVVKTTGWVRNEIDALILARLEQAGLQPSPEAERTTLIRRLSLDLRGLPPSLKEVDEFLADTHPDAYERLVDRFLASPHYGEKMAQLWLDLARFGDTSGYEFDSTRQMWLWRDWVINAFNSNKSFDQFTIEQLAGDLLPNATIEQKIASGFNRNTRFNEEAGSDPEEFLVRYNVDRTNTLGQVWLGLTLGCAECHSHKYDPITQKEYYQLFAFFTGIKEPPVSGNHNQPLPPLLTFPTKAQEETIARLKSDIDAIEKQAAGDLKQVYYQDPPLDETRSKKPPEETAWIDDDLPAGAIPQGESGWHWVKAPEPVLSGTRALKQTATGLHQSSFTGAAPLEVRPGDKLFAHVWLDPKDPPKSVMLQWNDGTWEHRAYWGADACLLAGRADAPNHHEAGPLPKPGQWARLEVKAESVGLIAGAKLNGWSFVQNNGTVYFDKAGVVTHPGADSYLHNQAVWEESAKNNAALPGPVKEALKVEPAKRSDAQKTALHSHFLRYVCAATRPVFAPLNRQKDETAKKLKETEDAVPSVMVSEELPQRRPAFVLRRGDFQQRGEQVEPAVPAILPPLPQGQSVNRLALARWLTRSEHPLTSRVTVNRLWGQVFGTGLVRTVNDFGTQGELPSHPELLDWLATEFVGSGWDVKALLKKMVLSATYRQSSAFGGKASEVDPHNRLLSRAPRYRLTAEELRDNALAIAGLLNPKIGGPSVMPYQPAGYYNGKYESWKWNESPGGDLYRRGLYTFWRRTSLHPMLIVFDAPSREECTAFRSRTNTPLQALVTLNDPTFVEAARVFAQRLLKDGPSDLDGRLVFAFRSAVARTPNAAEKEVLAREYQRLRARYQGDAKAAAELVKAGRYPAADKLDVIEHAAWTAVANLLLNLDETVTRE